MKRLGLLILILDSFLTLSAQESFTISKPDLSFQDNIITIKYDIYGGSSVYVNISLIVLNSKGDTIKPRYISGNIGKGVSCGPGKIIKWNLEKDNVKISDSLSVFIIGEKYISPVAGNEYGLPNQLTRGKVILSSLFVPGLGQKKASGNKAFYVLSGLAYGSLGASLYFNFKSDQYKKDYEASMKAEESDNLYNKWQKSYNASKYLAIGAAGVWAVNLIWAAVIPINEKNVNKMHVSLYSINKDELMICARWNF